MKATTLFPLIALSLLSVMPAIGAETLEKRLQKHTLDRMPSVEPTLSSSLIEVAKRYKEKYGEELPIFIGVELFTAPAKLEVNPGPVPKIPGLEPVEDPKPAEAGSVYPADARTSVTISNIPLIEVLKYITSVYNIAFVVRSDVILIRKTK